MFEPQGTGFFLALMVAFAGLLVWVALAKQVVFRVFAACLAFIPAMVFGVAAVNKYYDYYGTWGALVNDLSGQGGNSIPKVAAVGVGTNGQFDRDIGLRTNKAEDAELGYDFQTTITGPRSHLTRTMYVYLPPQYFQPAYAHYKFPVIELLHGSPGDPQAWVDVLGVIPTFLAMVQAHPADAAVLVMPDTDGGETYGLQCLNDPRPGGIQDMTFVGQDVPAYLAKVARVQPQGKAWGIAGDSEGGYCAANIGLQMANDFGFVGVLSGYFAPIDSQVPAGNKPGGKPLVVNVFRGYPQQALINTPEKYIQEVPITDEVPSFFLAAGAADQGDIKDLGFFQQELKNRVANVPVDIVPGAGHSATVWRNALTPMFAWMAPQLAAQAAKNDRNAAAAASAAAAKRKHQLGTQPTPKPSAKKTPLLSRRP